jgi:hypothetical protein
MGAQTRPQLWGFADCRQTLTCRVCWEEKRQKTPELCGFLQKKSTGLKSSVFWPCHDRSDVALVPTASLLGPSSHKVLGLRLERMAAVALTLNFFLKPPNKQAIGFIGGDPKLFEEGDSTNYYFYRGS